MQCTYKVMVPSGFVDTFSAALTASCRFTRIWNFYGDLISPATMKPTQFFMWSARHFGPIFSTFLVFRHIFIDVSNTKFHGNPFSGSHAGICGRTNGRAWRS